MRFPKAAPLAALRKEQDSFAFQHAGKGEKTVRGTVLRGNPRQGFPFFSFDRYHPSKIPNSLQEKPGDAFASPGFFSLHRSIFCRFAPWVCRRRMGQFVAGKGFDRITAHRIGRKLTASANFHRQIRCGWIDAGGTHRLRRRLESIPHSRNPQKPRAFEGAKGAFALPCARSPAHSL